METGADEGEALQETHCEYWASVQVNGTPRCWQDSLGDLLRRWAHRIDGRVTLAIEITTLPEIEDARKDECIQVGLAAIKRAAEYETRVQVMEGLLRTRCSKLFEDQA